MYMRKLIYKNGAQHIVCAQRLSRVWLFVNPWTIAHQAPLSVEFSRLEYWSVLLFPTPGDHPDPGVKLVSSMCPALAGRFFTSMPPGNLKNPTQHIMNNQQITIS